MSGDAFHITKDHPLLADYVDSLQRKNAECLSFYPRAVFDREIARGRILLGMLNNEPCGYLYMGSGADGTLRCHQVCIQFDARRRLYGACLVAAMEEHAVNLGCAWVRLRCGFDIEANDFWKSLGYICVRHDLGGVRRMRTINIWQKAVSPVLFQEVGIEPASGKTTAALWRRHKQTGIVTQFVRGERMREYRASLEAAILAPSPADAERGEK